MMQGRLYGKCAIVTGAGTGIGEAIARKFVKEGAQVCLAGLPTDPVQDVVNDLNEERPGRATCFTGDLSNEGDARRCVEHAVERFGRLDVLVNNAGVFVARAEIQDYPIDKVDETIRNNIRSAVLMTRYAMPHLHVSHGNVLFTGSESGVIGLESNAAYGGTKGFLHAFMRGVAVEQARHGVRANCVCPGPIDTAWTHDEKSPTDADPQQGVVANNPMGRRGTPAEVANVFAFLASDEASYVTGSLYAVDGGTVIDKGGTGRNVPKELRKAPPSDLNEKHRLDGQRNKDVGSES